MKKTLKLLALVALLPLLLAGTYKITKTLIILNGVAIDASGNVDLPAGTDVTVDSVSATSLVGQIVFDIYGGGATTAITAGTLWEGRVQLPWDVTLTSWEVTSTESGTCTGDIYYCGVSDWSSATSVSGGQGWAITASDVARDLDIADWAESQVAQDQVLVCVVYTATETNLCVTLKTRRR